MPSRTLLRVALLIVAIAGLASRSAAQSALGTSFTYQGQLASSGTPANGSFDFRFRLFPAVDSGLAIGPTLCVANVTVANGQFAVVLDFGAVFSGNRRYLEVSVRPTGSAGCADTGGFVGLSPRQELTATPNAAFSLSSGAALFAATAGVASTSENSLSLGGQPPSFYTNPANLQGTLPDGLLSPNVARLNANQTFTGVINFNNPNNTFSGSAAALTNLQGANLIPGSVARSTLTSDLRNSMGVYSTDWRNTPYLNSSNVSTGDGPNRIAISGGFAYVTNGLANRLQVFSLVDAANPVLISSIGTANSPRGVAVAGQFVYVTCQVANRLQIFDVSNPTAPALLSTTVTDRAPVSIAVSGNLAFIANFAGGSVQAFDVSNPSAPVPAGIIGLSGGNPVSVVASGTTAFVVTQGQGSLGNSLVAVSAATPLNLTIRGSTPAGPGPASIALAGTTAYVVNLAPPKALQVFDVSDPTTPALVGSFVTQQDMGAVTVAPPFAFVANLSTAAVDVYDVTAISAPVRLGSVAAPDVGELSTSGAYVYVVSYDSDRLRAYSGGATGLTYSVPLIANLTGNASTASTATNATNLGGQSAAFYTNAASLSTGVLDNARTTGSAASNPNSLVLRDSSGNFSAGTITASLAGTASNAANLGGQPASFYTNANNLSAGTIPDARLAASIPRVNTVNVFSANQGFGSVSTPAAPLHVGGSVLVGNNGVDNIAFGVDAGTNPRLGIVKQFGQFPMFVAASGTPMIFAQNNQAGILSNPGSAVLSERLRIDAVGNVGIANSSPIQTLDINGRLRVANGVIQNGSTPVNGTADMGLYSQGAGQWIRMVTNNGAFQWYIDGGTTSIGGGPLMTLNGGGLTVNTNLAKAGGSFKIDHPLDPKNKFLYHSFVESPDMMNVYNGNVTTDGAGFATVTLPDYFQALNRDFRYQLTVIDDSEDFALVKVTRQIGDPAANQFVIRSSRPRVLVSWQVTGIRQDAWAEKNRIPTTVDKPLDQRGTYLHPEVFPASDPASP